MAEHPIILALFSGAGGRLILYRPNMPPLEAPSVPLDYQLMKSVGHSSMAISEVVMPFLENPKDKSWVASMQSYRSRMKSAVDGVDAMPIRADWRETVRIILKNNLDFMDECLAKGVITQAALDQFAKKQGPSLKKIIAGASRRRSGTGCVVADWKKMLGASWDKTYGASNTTHVARQNNILFSVLAQFFWPGRHQPLVDTDRDSYVHDHAAGHAGFDGPHYFRSLGGLPVLWQLSCDGLRADGRRRARRSHRRKRKARHEAVPAATGAIRLEAMADADHAGPRPHDTRRFSVTRQACWLLLHTTEYAKVRR
jgi:hypothetical protein